MANTTWSCLSCVDPTLPSSLPLWRQNIAIAFLVTHVIFHFSSFLRAWLYRNHVHMQGRDPHLLSLLAVGALATIQTPVREIVGDENYPCSVQSVMASLVNAFLLAPIMVRTLRLVALHNAQSRVQTLIHQRSYQFPRVQSEKSLVSVNFQSDTTINIDKSAAETLPPGAAATKDDCPPPALPCAETTIQDVNPDTTTTPQAASHYLHKRSNSNDDINDVIDGKAAGSTELAVASSAESRPETHTTAAPFSNRYSDIVQRIITERIKIHKSSRQMIVWGLFAIIFTLPNLLYVVNHRDIYFGQRNGCRDITDSNQTYIVSGTFIIVSILAFAYIRRRPDAYHLREEMAVLVAGTVVIAAAISLFKAFNISIGISSAYLFVVGSWVASSVCFVLPTRRAIRMGNIAAVAPGRAAEQSPDDNSTGAASPENKNNNNNNNNRNSSNNSSTITVDQMRQEEVEGCKPAWEEQLVSLPIAEHALAVLQGMGGSVEEPDPIRGGILPGYSRRLSSGAGYNGSMKWESGNRSIAAQLCPLLFQRAETDNAIARAEQALALVVLKQPHQLSRSDYDVLTVFLCCTSVGRKSIRDILSREWSTELLLFMLDVAYFGTMVQRVQKAHMALTRVSEDHESTLLPGASQVGHISGRAAALQTLAEAVENSLTAAQHTIGLYLSGTSAFPVNISATAVRNATREVNQFAAAWKKAWGEVQALRSTQVRGIDISPFAGAFTQAAREVLTLLSCGPVMRFAASPSFVRFQKSMEALLIRLPHLDEITPASQPDETQK